jgi:hypothetical protein
MKVTNLIAIIIILFAGYLSAQEANIFGDYFIDKTMRIDYHHIGDASSEIVSIDKIYKYGIWAGSRVNLVDRLNNGRYYIKIYDKESELLIYSRGFDSYFGEYQTSEPASKEVKKAFHETAIIPFPLKPIYFALEKRDEQKKLKEIVRFEIDPADVMIIEDKIIDDFIVVETPVYSGDPHSKVDLVILGEGYTKNEIPKFNLDLRKFVNTFFNHEPYKSYKKNFNVYGVLKPSQESGVDEPRAGIFKNTTLNCTFNSMGSERYLLTEDNKSIHDVAAHVPYDAIYMMVNHKRYGGGGIYNFFCTFTTDNQFNDYLFLHEFGHSFAGLADEYYTSSTAYDGFYKPTVEPVEANITALLDKENLKWKDMLTPNVELPTLWEKEDFDKMDYAWQERRRQMNDRIAELKKTGESKEDIEAAENEYTLRDKEHSDKVDKYLRSSKYWGTIGAFEGAGYLAKGLYRPMLDCIMFSKGNKPFCKVCEEAIIRIIKIYGE